MTTETKKLEALQLAGETLAAFMTVAQHELPPEVSAAMRRGLDAGELDVRIVIEAGAAGMSVSGAFTDKAGNVTTFMNVFLPPDDETESRNETGTPPSLH